MKRPLFRAVLGFALGEVLSILTGWVFKMGILFGVLFCLAFLCYRKKESYRVILIFLISIVLGFLRMHLAQIPHPLEQFVQVESDIQDENSAQNAEYEVTTFGKSKNEGLLVEVTGRIIYAYLPDGDRTDYIVKVERTSFSGGYTEESYHLLLYGNGDYAIGQRIKLTGELRSFESPSNPGEFHQANYYRARKLYFYMWSPQVEQLESDVYRYREWLRRLRENIALQLYRITDEESAALYTGILLGEKGGIDRNLKKMYQMVGIAHILAISGLHISMLGGGLFRILRKMGISYSVSVLATLVFAFSYGALTGFGASTLRALIMLTVLMVGELIGRSYDLLTSLAVALLIMLLYHPYYLLDGGVWLSFSAVAGVALGKEMAERKAGMREEKQKRKCIKVPNKFAWIQSGIINTIIISAWIQISTLPVLIYHYYGFSPYSFLVNLLVVPLMTLVLFFGLCGIFFSIISLSVSGLWIMIGASILKFYQRLCEVCLTLPESYINLGKPHIFQILIFYGMVLTAFLLFSNTKKKKMKKKSRRLFLLAMAVGVFGIVFLHFLNRQELIVFLDVGQGDGILIRTESGRNLVIDGGSVSEKKVGEYVLLPALCYYGMAEVDYWFISHADEDHVSGLKEILEDEGVSQVKINHLVVSKEIYQDESWEEIYLLAEKKNIPVIWMEAGDMLTDGTFSMVCYHPDKDFVPSDRNQASLVLGYHSDMVDVLFTGDTDEVALDYMLEEELPKFKDNIRYDILKVPHHGSKYSICDELYELTEGSVAVISCGANNVYGHPHDETLNYIESAGCQIYRTDVSGAIIIQKRNRFTFKDKSVKIKEGILQESE